MLKTQWATVAPCSRTSSQKALTLKRSRSAMLEPTSATESTPRSRPIE